MIKIGPLGLSYLPINDNYPQYDNHELYLQQGWIRLKEEKIFPSDGIESEFEMMPIKEKIKMRKIKKMIS